MVKRSNPAAVTETAFNCPHCGAYTTQTWFVLLGKQVDTENRVPNLADQGSIDNLKQKIKG